MNIKNKVLLGEQVELSNNEDDFGSLWFQKKTGMFCLEFNGSVIKASKTFSSISKKITEKLLVEV